MLATILSRSQHGLSAPQVRIDVHITSGLPATHIVGLPETSIKESRDRVRSAILSSDFEYPNGRITVNLAPADLPKDGARFDLPIAIGLLVASGQLPPADLADCELYGELALGGTVRPVRGLLPAVCVANRRNRRVILPRGNLEEAQLVNGARIGAARDLKQVAHHLRGVERLRFVAGHPQPTSDRPYPDLADVRGQPHARRAVEIAAAGSHSLLLIGSPGTGKSMLAQRLPGLLPPLTEAEALEVATVTSLSSAGFTASDWRHRPFRAPHHSCTSVALIGGGSYPAPGEISLAHHGVLFLDELPEFDRHALESLREPLETARITLARAARQAEYPARFQLVAAMNPCPCGYLDESPQQSGRPCRCSYGQIQRYQGRISGPLLDRLDMHVRMQPILPTQLSSVAEQLETTATVAARVATARKVQRARQPICNAHLDTSQIDRFCDPTPEGRAILDLAVQRFCLTARACHRILKVARTIADLEASGPITAGHITESLLFRHPDPFNAYPRARDRSYSSQTRDSPI